MKTKPHSANDRPILGLTLVFLLIVTLPCDAQKLRSRYNLSNVKIGLMNGKRISGTLTSFTEDSLALRDTHIAPPGSFVVLYSRDLRLRRGTVTAVSRENLVITEERSGNILSIPRDRITSFQVKKCTCSSYELSQFQQRWYPSSSINYISLHKNGSGAKGALLGMALGAAAGALLAGNKQSDSSGGYVKVVSDEAVGILAGGLIGLCAGIPLGLINSQLFIGGDRDKFNEVRKTIVRP